MATSLLSPATTASRASSTASSLPLHLAAVIVGATSILIGIVWDISWHRTIGRDTFWTPAHMAVYFGGTLAGLSCGARVLWDSFGGGRDTAIGVRVWRWFTGPIGGWVCIWGALMMLTSAPFDDWWHNAYGLDVEILSPPHVVLLIGIAGILTGAQTMAASAQNRDGRSRGLALAFLFSSGVLASMAAIAITEYTLPQRLHQSLFYIVTGGVFPAILVAAARASTLRWPATITAAIYMAVMAGQVWLLPLFPGSPKLGPIGHTVTQMVPLAFPTLLVVPAFAIDVVMHRFHDRNPWLVSLLLGVAFVLAFPRGAVALRHAAGDRAGPQRVLRWCARRLPGTGGSGWSDRGLSGTRMAAPAPRCCASAPMRSSPPRSRHDSVSHAARS